jgi:hypothetical protein
MPEGRAAIPRRALRLSFPCEIANGDVLQRYLLTAFSSPNFPAIGVFAALWSFGVGGNLPVDSAIFLEFLPASHQYLLTILSIDWAFAQVVATLVAWPVCLIGFVAYRC